MTQKREKDISLTSMKCTFDVIKNELLAEQQE